MPRILGGPIIKMDAHASLILKVHVPLDKPRLIRVPLYNLTTRQDCQ
jgi:hypothetical protein